MSKKIGARTLLVLLSSLVIQPIAFAQPTKAAGDTLIDKLNAESRGKEGYSFAHRIIDFPDGIAKLCDKKQTRIVCGQISYRSPACYIDKKGNKNYVQGQADPIYKDSIVYSYYYFSSIAVWNDKTNAWDIVYKEE